MERKKIVLYVLFAIFLAYIVFSPKFFELRKLREENLDAQKRIRALRQDNDILREKLKKLEEDPDYLEEKAREKLGVVKKGEFIYKSK